MADSDWIILCDYAFPAMHGKLCMIGIFDTIFSNAVPVTHSRAAIGFNIIGEPGEEVPMTLQIISPSGEVVQSWPIKFVLPDAGSAFAHVEIQNLELKEFGRHAIQLDVSGGTPKVAWFTLRKLQERQ